MYIRSFRSSSCYNLTKFVSKSTSMYHTCLRSHFSFPIGASHKSYSSKSLMRIRWFSTFSHTESDSNQCLQDIYVLLNSENKIATDIVMKSVKKFNTHQAKIKFFQKIDQSIQNPPLYTVTISNLLTNMNLFRPDDIIHIFRFVVANENPEQIQQLASQLANFHLLADINKEELSEIIKYYLRNKDKHDNHVKFLHSFVDFIEMNTQKFVTNTLVEYLTHCNRILSKDPDEFLAKSERIDKIVLNNLSRFEKELINIEGKSLVELFYILHDHINDSERVKTFMNKLEKRIEKNYNVINMESVIKLLKTLQILEKKKSKLWEALDEDIVIKIHYISVPQILQIIEIYSYMRLGSDTLFSECSKRLGSYLHTIDKKMFPDLVFSLSKGESMKEELAFHIEKQILENLEIFTSEQLAKVYWSFANSSLFKPQSIKTLENVLTDKCTELDMTSLSLVWDGLLASQKFDHPIFANSKENMKRFMELDQKIEGMGNTQIANLVFSYLKVDVLADLEAIAKRYVMKRVMTATEDKFGVALLQEINSMFGLNKDKVENNVDLLQTIRAKGNEMIASGKLDSEIKEELKLTLLDLEAFLRTKGLIK